MQTITQMLWRRLLQMRKSDLVELQRASRRSRGSPLGVREVWIRPTLGG
jgi:hypothetical protein